MNIQEFILKLSNGKADNQSVEKMKKVIFSIIFIIIVFMVILGAFYINKDKKFKATATVIDIISF